MVATRRGVRVCSPIKTKTDSDESPDVQATPSTGRSTRSRAAQLDTAASEDESRKQQSQESAEESVPSSQNRRTLKRCTRSARLHSPQHSCTPTGSVHEADVSDMESSCSALSDSEPPAADGKARRPRTSQEEEAGSEAESCSSLAPEKRVTRRSARARKTPQRPWASPSDQDQEASPQRATRSTRKNARSRAPGEGVGDLSDAGSCASGTAPAAPPTTTGRATRSGRRAPLGQPDPLHLDAASEDSLSPARGRRTRAARGAPGGTALLSCDSEGLESGPSTPMRRSTRSRGGSTPALGTESDSDLLEVTLAPGRTPVLSIVLDRVLGEEPGEVPVVPMEGTEARSTGGQSPLDDSKLDRTAEEEADCTVVEDKTITLDDDDDDDDDEEEEGATRAADPGPLGAAAEGAETISVGHEGSVAVSASADGVPEEAVDGESQDEDVPSPAGCEVTTDGQQSAPSGDGEHDTPTQEALSSGAESEGAPPSPCLGPVETEDDMEVDAADHQTRQGHDSDQAARPIEVKPNPDPTVKVDPAEPALRDSDVIVHQKKKVISLLDSSDEEEEEEEEEDEDGNLEESDSGDCQILEEDNNVERGEPERAGSSKLPDGAVAGGLFMIDTRPGQGADELYLKDGEQDPAQEEEEDDEDFVDEEGGGDDDDDEDAQLLQFTRNPKMKDLSSRIDPGLRVAELGGLYISLDGSKSKPVSNSLKKQKAPTIQDEVMKNSVMGPEFEKHSAAPPYSESKHRLKLERKKQKEKTTGDSWFNMKAPELTPELKADLKVLKMRGSLDPKRFYKKNDRDGLPKYFQVGTVMDSPLDFYHSRIPKKDRKRTMVEELMADSDFRRQNKKKYLEVMAEKTAQAAGRSKKKRFKQKKIAV